MNLGVMQLLDILLTAYNYQHIKQDKGMMESAIKLTKHKWIYNWFPLKKKKNPVGVTQAEFT